MSGKILIIDPVATNRIVFKVKMLAAQYAVETCESCDDAQHIMDDVAPDLILINLQDKNPDGYRFCRQLRNTPKTADIAIVSTGAADTAQSRFRALDAGADDVLDRPISDALLLSRVRNLLRRRNAQTDLMQSDGTGRVFGFEERRAACLAPAKVSVVCYDAINGMSCLTDLQTGLRQPVQMITGPRQFTSMLSGGTPDVLVVHGADGLLSRAALLQLVCDFRARAQTCHTAQLVIVNREDSDLAAMLLDLGATDVVFTDADPAELTLRTERLIASKAREDALRDRVRRGLLAAVTDPLTGLFNRRYAESQLRQIANQSAQSGQSYAVVMIDLDHFKSINDRFGHAAGDIVLKEVAQRLQNHIHDGDFVARIGGEEFLVALPRTGIDIAEAAGENLRRLIADLPFCIGNGHDPLRVTASVGIAIHAEALECAADDTALGAIFERADAALYSAKSAGRDAVSVCSSAA